MIFKYYDFFVDSFSVIAEQFGSNLDYLHLNIILPVEFHFTLSKLSHIQLIFIGKR